MAIVTTDNKHYKAIADAIREKTEKTDTIFPADMPTSVGEVYDAGKEAERRERWENILLSLRRNSWGAKFAFAGKAWTDDTFDPPPQMDTTLRPYNAEQFFRECAITDLKGKLEKANVVMDFSDTLYSSNFAYYSAITNFPTINLSKSNAFDAAFAYLKGENVTLPLILGSEGNPKFPGTFDQSTGLTNLTIVSGVIGNNIDLRWSPLTLESIESVLDALSPNATGMTATFNLDAVNKAFETDYGKGDGSNSAYWQDRVAGVPNWTIALVNP
jgi:hypothetical protein